MSRIVLAFVLPFIVLYGPMIAAGAAVKWLGSDWAIPSAIGVLVLAAFVGLSCLRR